MKTVKIAKVGSRVVEVSLEDGATVSDALRAGGVSLSSTEALKISGTSVEGSFVPANGAVITILPQIKGGC